MLIYEAQRSKLEKTENDCAAIFVGIHDVQFGDEQGAINCLIVTFSSVMNRMWTAVLSYRDVPFDNEPIGCGWWSYRHILFGDEQGVVGAGGRCAVGQLVAEELSVQRAGLRLQPRELDGGGAATDRSQVAHRATRSCAESGPGSQGSQGSQESQGRRSVTGRQGIGQRSQVSLDAAPEVTRVRKSLQDYWRSEDRQGSLYVLLVAVPDRLNPGSAE